MARRHVRVLVLALVLGFVSANPAAGAAKPAKCRGTMVWYAGKCMYPKDVQAAKARARAAAAKKGDAKKREEEAARLEAEKQAEEQRKREEEERAKVEATRLEEERRAAERRVIEEEVARRLEEQKKIDDARRAEEERVRQEDQAREEARAAEKERKEAEKERTRSRIHLLGSYQFAGYMRTDHYPLNPTDQQDLLGEPGGDLDTNPNAGAGVLVEFAHIPYLYMGFLFQGEFGVVENRKRSPLAAHIADIDFTLRGRYPFLDDMLEVSLLLPVGFSIAGAKGDKDWSEIGAMCAGDGDTTELCPYRVAGGNDVDYGNIPGFGMNVGLGLGFGVTIARSIGFMAELGYRYHTLWFSEKKHFGPNTSESIRFQCHEGYVSLGMFFRL